MEEAKSGNTDFVPLVEISGPNAPVNFLPSVRKKGVKLLAI